MAPSYCVWCLCRFAKSNHAFKMWKIGFRSVTKCFQLSTNFHRSSRRHLYIHVLHVEVVLPSFLSHNYCRADFFRMDFILTCLWKLNPTKKFHYTCTLLYVRLLYYTKLNPNVNLKYETLNLPPYGILIYNVHVLQLLRTHCIYLKSWTWPAETQELNDPRVYHSIPILNNNASFNKKTRNQSIVGSQLSKPPLSEPLIIWTPGHFLLWKLLKFTK